MYIILFTVAVDIVANPRCGNISQYIRLTEKKIMSHIIFLSGLKCEQYTKEPLILRNNPVLS